MTTAPPAHGPTASVAPRQIGEATVWTLKDGELPLHATDLRGIGLERVKVLIGGDHVVVPVNAFLVQVRGKTVLVDTGGGGNKAPGWDTGHLLEQLASTGVAPAQVDLIVVTHFHSDHAYGLLLLGPMVTRIFPNATLRISHAEREFWLGDPAKVPELFRERVLWFRAVVASFQAAGRFATFEDGEELAPGVRTLPSRGHTPGHTVYVFGAPGNELWCTGDLVHLGAVQLAHPEAYMAFDSDGASAVASRRALLRAAAAEEAVLAPSHLAELVRVKPKGEGFVARPVAP